MPAIFQQGIPDRRDHDHDHDHNPGRAIARPVFGEVA
jgi:hypothetical protein